MVITLNIHWIISILYKP